MHPGAVNEYGGNGFADTPEGNIQNTSHTTMERYIDPSDNSGVSGYEIGLDSITVQFKDGGIYRYDYVSAGRENIEKMKRLALRGVGLNTFINQNIRNAYAAKLR